MMNMYKESEILVSSRGRFRIKVCPSHPCGPTLNDDPPCFKVAEHSFNTCTKIAKKRGDDICSITVALIFVSYLLFPSKMKNCHSATLSHGSYPMQSALFTCK